MITGMAICMVRYLLVARVSIVQTSKFKELAHPKVLQNPRENSKSNHIETNHMHGQKNST